MIKPNKYGIYTMTFNNHYPVEFKIADGEAWFATSNIGKVLGLATTTNLSSYVTLQKKIQWKTGKRKVTDLDNIKNLHARGFDEWRDNSLVPTVEQLLKRNKEIISEYKYKQETSNGATKSGVVIDEKEVTATVDRKLGAKDRDTMLLEIALQQAEIAKANADYTVELIKKILGR